MKRSTRIDPAVNMNAPEQATHWHDSDWPAAAPRHLVLAGSQPPGLC